MHHYVFRLQHESGSVQQSYLFLVLQLTPIILDRHLDRDATVGTELGSETSNLARSELVHASG